MTADERNRRILDFATRHAPDNPDEVALVPYNIATVQALWKHKALGWGMAVSLYFDTKTHKTEIGSSGTTRNLAHALAFSSLYRRVVEFAAALEVYAASLPEPEEDQ